MKALRSRIAIGLAAALIGALTAGYASYALAAPSTLSNGSGSVRARVAGVGFGASVHLEVPNLVDLAVQCYDSAMDQTTFLTLTNERPNPEYAWIAVDGANPVFSTIPANGVKTYPLNDQGLQVHVVYGPDDSASGPVHIRNRQSSCLVGMELASNMG